jgi:hypothetical protein
MGHLALPGRAQQRTALLKIGLLKIGIRATLPFATLRRP